MKNVNLNPGGFIGLFLVLAASVIYAYMATNGFNPDEELANDSRSIRSASKLFIAILIGGVFGGNVLWDKLYGKKK